MNLWPVSEKIKVAVIGVGALGQHHARYYADLAAHGVVEFVGVCDESTERARKTAATHGVPVLENAKAVTEAAEAISVVTPTFTHFDLAKFFLKQGRHVLVEKPMTDETAQAAELAE